MGNLLHGGAKTTPKIRKEIQDSDKSIAALARQYNLNPKTVRCWKHAGTTADKKSGPKTRVSVLISLEQQAVCEVRRTLQLPLDDLFIIFKPTKNILPHKSKYFLNPHYTLGILAVPFILWFAITGTTMVFHKPTTHIVTSLFDSTPPNLPTEIVNDKNQAFKPWMEILRVINKILPEGELQSWGLQKRIIRFLYLENGC